MENKVFEITPEVNSAQEFIEIAQDFSNPLDLVREAISNAFDAKAKNILMDFSVISEYGEKLLKIEITDDGHGMDAEGLKSFFDLGNSSRRLDQEAIGEKGHGTKVFFNSKKIEVVTVKNEIRYRAEMDEPKKKLFGHRIPSTIDNRTMNELLNKINKGTRLIFSGDIYQIESIDFGNWFYYAKDIIKAKGANIELLHNWRTDKRDLSSLWDEVREKKPIITEKLSIDGPFSKDLCEDIFELEDNEVVLCLNYDGKFGLNNINQYFQNANTKSKAFSWAEWSFKIGDQIIFLDTRRSSLLYNNLKGKIENIEKTASSIIFTLNVKTYLAEEQCQNESFEYVENTDDGTKIKLEVIAWDDELSEEDRIKTVIPFQLAYAISIHKAQGLEYNAVKVVIPSNNAERITHSIFYTAITRAKEKLTIFWSAETMDAIVKSFTEKKVENKTLQIIKQKLNIQEE